MRERKLALGPFAAGEIDVRAINDLLAKPATLSAASKYRVMSGVLYLCAGALLVA